MQALAPGLTDQQIDTLTAPYGIDLPEEARVWWRWHNGRHADVGHAQYFPLPVPLRLTEQRG